MTPSGWTFNNLVALGAAWMFGGIIVGGLLGAWVGRRRGATRGMGTGLLVWGLGNLLVAVMVWVFVQFDSTVVTIVATRCEPSGSTAKGPYFTLYYALQRPGEPAHEVTAGGRSGVCPESPMPVDALRVRKDALAAPTALVHADWADDDAPLAVIVTWSAFGLFAVFGASLLLTHGDPSASPSQRPQGPVAGWRKGIGSLIGQLGVLLVLAALIGPHFLPGTTERAIAFGLRTGATALGCFIASGLLAGSMAWPAVAFLMLFVLAMLGVGELVAMG